jgi:EpsI family protein
MGNAEMDHMRRWSYASIIALFIALIAYTYALRYRAIERPPAPALDSLPKEIGGYAGTSEADDPEALKILGADATLQRTYRNGAERIISLYIGFFGAQQENSQIHSPKHCYPGAGWNILEEGSTNIPLMGKIVPVKHLVISNGAEKQYLLYWFTSADGILTNEFALKWNQMKNSLLSRSQATAFVRFSIDVTGETETGARDDLVQFVGLLAPHIEEILRSSGSASSERTP